MNRLEAAENVELLLNSKCISKKGKGEFFSHIMVPERFLERAEDEYQYLKDIALLFYDEIIEEGLRPLGFSVHCIESGGSGVVLSARAYEEEVDDN